MDFYKKKSLKFCNSEVSRDSRHAETLKARESSRFKRLSMLRSMDEENSNETEIKAEKEIAVTKKPLSRLEMLFKWKQEKQTKKELEKKNMKKPFYVGCQSLKSTSNKINPATSTQPSRTGNVSIKMAASTSLHSSRIPNHSKVNGAKNTAVAKVNSVSTKTPNNKTGNSVVSRTNQNSFPRAAKINNKEPVVKHASNSSNIIKMKDNNSLKTKSQESSLRKPNFVKQPSKPVSKESSLPKPNFSKQQSKPVSRIGIPTFSTNLSKGIPGQKTQDQSLPKPTNFNKTTKSVPVSKPGEKKAPCLMEKVTLRKKECSSKTASNTQAAIKSTDKKEAPSLCDHSLENVKDTIFECDVSIIKRAPSFAPADFKFMPPVGVPGLFFDDDAFQRIKAKFVTRTSTPSKPSKKSLDPSSFDSPSEVEINLLEECPDQLVNMEKQTEKKTGKDCNEVSKNTDVEEKLEKDSDVQLVRSITAKDESLPKEENKLTVNELPKLTVDPCIDSPLIFTDLSKLKEIVKRVELMVPEKDEQLEDEDKEDDDSLKEEDPDQCTEKKVLSAPPKRTSILKNIPVLNSIAETSETEDYITQTPAKYSRNKQKPVFTPRRSERLSKLALVEDSPTSSIAGTPRRSVRLQGITPKKCQFGNNEVLSPLHENKSASKILPRRSMRLIDLNTPDKETNGLATCESNITADFEMLNLKETENMNPHACLIDFDSSPCPVSKLKSKKISLLYSPEKTRRSMRRSIKGDLMSFSPCT